MSVAENILVVAGYEQKKPINIGSALKHVDSIHKESYRQRDYYDFWVDKGGVVDPDTNSYIHDIIGPDSHTNPYLGLVEFSILWQLDSWSVKDDSNLAVWISPSKIGEPKCADHKIIIHQIDYSPAGQRKVNNISIVFHGPTDVILTIAQKISALANSLQTPEEVRSLLLPVNENITVADILELIEPFVPKNKKYVPMTEETRYYLGSLYARGASNSFIAKEWARLGALGEFRLECTGGGSISYSDILNKNSLSFFPAETSIKYVKNCGNCGAIIEAYISSGYTCSHCGGTYLGC